MNIYTDSKFNNSIALDTHQCLQCQNLISMKQDFCCQGCEVAYKICTKLAVITQPKNNIRFLKHTKKSSSQIFELTLDIENIHCIGCVQHIQKTILKEKNIVTVHTTMSSKKIYIAWRGNAQQANCFVNLITRLGYIVSNICVSNYNAPLKSEIQHSGGLRKYRLVSGILSLFLGFA